ncbi:MAG: zinc-dependent peptidase [Candidatus Krumholzibacteriia bacterium]
MLFRRWRRRKLLSTPWPPAWRTLAEDHIPLYRRLPEPERERLHGLVQVFLDEKSFEGCGGQVVDDEVRLFVATQACLLLLGDDVGYLPRLHAVLIYPQSFRVQREYHHDDGLVTEAHEEFLGESWGSGALVLSWEDIRHDTARPEEGYNVVLHEFAHQLDEETGAADGMPLLPDAELAADWPRICSAEYDRLCRQVDRRRETFLDPYAAEDPAEFFAVITETFFTIPVDFRRAHPDLYALLARYYGTDPSRWSG